MNTQSNSTLVPPAKTSNHKLTQDELLLLKQLNKAGAVTQGTGKYVNIGPEASAVEALDIAIENQGLESEQLLDFMDQLLQRGYFTNGPAGKFKITDKLIQLYEELDQSAALTETQSESFSLRMIQSDSELASLQESWDKISTEPLRGFIWHYQWWTEFAGSANLRVYGYERNGELVGIAPFFEDQWLGQSVLRFIGSGKVCTDYAGLIVSPQYHRQFVEALRDELNLDGGFDVIEMEGVDSRGPSEAFKSELESKFWSYEKLIDSCWYLELPETWEEFVKDSPRSLRRKIRKAEKRLGSGEVSIRSTSADLEFEQAFEILVELHQLRFEAKGEPGVFADPKFLSFLKLATKELCENRLAEINISYVDGEPLAAQHYLFCDSGPQFYQGGLRVDRMDLEPGHLMFTYAVKRAIERGSVEFDFLRGNETYKAFWGATERHLSMVRFVSRRAKPTLINYAFGKARAAKHALTKQVRRFRTK